VGSHGGATLEGGTRQQPRGLFCTNLACIDHAFCSRDSTGIGTRSTIPGTYVAACMSCVYILLQHAYVCICRMPCVHPELRHIHAHPYCTICMHMHAATCACMLQNMHGYAYYPTMGICMITYIHAVPNPRTGTASCVREFLFSGPGRTAEEAV
jgi:hypothetical protein